MTIVPIGNLALQVPESGSDEFVFELVEHMQDLIRHLAARCLEESLEAELERFLGRKRYRRRGRAQPKETGLYCSQCRSHQRQDFQRNGHYPRQLAIGWGSVKIHMPQAKYRCGGYVHLKFQTVRPRQRIWEDLRWEIQAEYLRGLSYRKLRNLAQALHVQPDWIIRLPRRIASNFSAPPPAFGRLPKKPKPANPTRSFVRSGSLRSACFESFANVIGGRSCFILPPDFKPLPLNSQTVFHE